MYRINNVKVVSLTRVKEMYSAVYSPVIFI